MYYVNSKFIGGNLRKYRKSKHLSLEHIGNAIGKTKATVSKYETSEIIPDVLTILELCNVLDCKVEDLFPSVPSMLSTKTPFNCNKIYMYYMTERKVISSTIVFASNENIQNSAILYNGIKAERIHKKFAYCYEGKYECSENVIYINLKNMESHKLGIEQVQIVIHLPLSNISNIYNCFITGLTPNLVPTVKKGIITTQPIDINKKNIPKLKISKEEINQIKVNNSWNLSLKQYDEFFYDSI